MSGLSKKDRLWLEEAYGPRANFNPTERLLYGHDIAAIPGLFKPLVGDTVPDAVVQPSSEKELVGLVRWAAARKIPLVPRGKGSSGYGGIIPAEKGIVVDFYRMRKVLTVEEKAESVTVEPGITWEQLDAELQKKGLTLRLYPTSYPSSSVGGWLAQGGAGIGSFEFGWIDDNVTSARIVLPSGEVRELAGQDLEVVSEAEGITGLISRVTLRVQKLSPLGVASIACPDAEELTRVFEQFIARRLPLWSVVFINPKMAELKNKAPVRTHHGRPAEARVILPAAYIATLAFREEDREEIMPALQEILKPCQGEILSDRIARHEWENRFKLMIVKRLGPSLVPAEVVVPLHKLGRAMEEIEQKVKQPVVKEGVIIRSGRGGKPEAVILGFIPSDQRKFSYNFVFGLVLSILKIAKKHGGRPYSTGLYFTREAEKILGKERLRKLKEFKKNADPGNILNPGKVLSGKLLGRVVGLASPLEPLVRPFGNRVITKGPIKVNDIYNVVPFDNYLLSIKLTGKQVKEALENGVSAVEEGKGKFPQISGFSFAYTPSAPKGERVKEIMVAGAPINADKQYTVATIDFMAAGGDGYTSFGDAVKAAKDYTFIGGSLKSGNIVYNDPGKWLRDVVVEYVKARKTVTAQTENRIREVN